MYINTFNDKKYGIKGYIFRFRSLVVIIVTNIIIFK